MGKGYHFLEQLGLDPELGGELLSGQPIVEICSDRRVLIENHFGVSAYSRETVIVKVKFGCICVCGSGLELLRMSKEQLVVCGSIDSVTMRRR